MIDNQEEKLENRYEIFDNHIYDINVNLCSFLFYDFESFQKLNFQSATNLC